jgi:hypothetical protein
MIMKKGAPYQTFTRITPNRAQLASPSQGTGPTPMPASAQLKAE